MGRIEFEIPRENPSITEEKIPGGVVVTFEMLIVRIGDHFFMPVMAENHPLKVTR